MNEKRIRALILLALVSWAILLTLISLSSISRFKLGLRSPNPAAQSSARHNHRIAHFVAFAVLSVLMGLYSRRPSGRIACLLAVIALGAAIELAQHWMFSIPTEIADIRDDSYGALLGMLAAILFIAIRQREEPRVLK